MNVYKITSTVVAAAILSVGAYASAQVVSGNGVSVVSTPVTTAITPGSTGTTVGTVAITGDATGAAITSIPVTVTTTGGATASNLSNCQFFNANGTALNTSGNVVTNVSGTNTFVLDTPLPVSAGTTTLTIRCNVASGTPSGSTFRLTVGAPNLAAGINARIDTAPSAPAGTQDLTLANISFDTTHSGSPISLSALPLTITAGNGGSLSNLSNCRVRDTHNLTGALDANSAATLNSAGATSVVFDAPFTIGAGGSAMLALTCDIAASTPVGSTFTVSIAPNTIPATVSGTGTTVTPTAAVTVGPNGLPPATSGTIVISAPGSLSGVIVSTPGVPNTGLGTSGFEALFILVLSALIALGGSLYLRYEIR